MNESEERCGVKPCLSLTYTSPLVTAIVHHPSSPHESLSTAHTPPRVPLLSPRRDSCFLGSDFFLPASVEEIATVYLPSCLVILVCLTIGWPISPSDGFLVVQPTKLRNIQPHLHSTVVTLLTKYRPALLPRQLCALVTQDWMRSLSYAV